MQAEQTIEGDTAAASPALMKAVATIIEKAVHSGKVDGPKLYAQIEPLVRASWVETAADVDVKKMSVDLLYGLFFDHVVHTETMREVQRAARMVLEKRVSDLEEFMSDPSRAAR